MRSSDPLSKTYYDDALDRALGELATSAAELDIENGDKTKIRERLLEEATKMAQEHWDGNSVTGLQSVFLSMEKFQKHGDVPAVSNMRDNIEFFAKEQY